MVPSTTVSTAVVLLLLALACFSIWPSLFKLSARRWRFEYFSLDFAIGCFLTAILVAFTLGNAGSEMSFEDRLVVVGRATAVWGLAAGVLFGVAQLLLVGAVSLLGLGTALPLTVALALVITLPFRLAGSGWPMLVVAVVLFAGSAFLAFRSAKAKIPSQRLANFRRGTLLAGIAGVAMGACIPLIRQGADPENGPGPYTILLGVCFGIFLSTVFVGLLLMNLPVIGAPIGMSKYFKSGAKLHALGLTAGLVWTLGAFPVLLIATQVFSKPSLVLVIPLLAVLVCMALSVFKWKEFSAAPQAARQQLGLCALGFLAALIISGFAMKP